MIWEYRIVYFGREPLDDEAGYEAQLHEGANMLNELGGAGWELVQFLGHPLSKSAWKHHAVFKRSRSG